MCLTCTTIISESFWTGPNSSSLSTCCASLYRSMLRRMSEMLSGVRPPFAAFWPTAPAASLTFVPPSAWELLRGFGVRNLCSTWKYERGYDAHRHKNISVASYCTHQFTSVQAVATGCTTVCRPGWLAGWAAYVTVINKPKVVI